MGLFADHLVVATPKHDVAVPYSAIRAVAILDDLPKDTKGRVLLFLHLERRVDRKNCPGSHGTCFEVIGYSHVAPPEKGNQGAAASGSEGREDGMGVKPCGPLLRTAPRRAQGFRVTPGFSCPGPSVLLYLHVDRRAGERRAPARHHNELKCARGFRA